jgi:hypothetical protein
VQERAWRYDTKMNFASSQRFENHDG